MKKQLLFVLIVGLVLIQGFISSNVSKKSVTDSFVLSTVGMLHDIVLNLLPPEIDSKLLLPAGTDPHVYVPTLQNIKDFNDASMIFAIGLDLEAQMHSALESLSSSKPVYFLGESLDKSTLISDGSLYDPHVWFDLELFANLVDYISSALIEHFPDHESSIVSNSTSYKKTLQQLDTYAFSKLNSLDPSQKWLITTHDAFSYFGRRYDFNILTLKGVNTSSSYSLFDQQKMHDVILENSLKAIFIEDSVSNQDLLNVVQKVNKSGLNTTIGGYLYADSLGTAASKHNTFESMFRYNIDTIFNALN